MKQYHTIEINFVYSFSNETKKTILFLTLIFLIGVNKKIIEYNFGWNETNL